MSPDSPSLPPRSRPGLGATSPAAVPSSGAAAPSGSSHAPTRRVGAGVRITQLALVLLALAVVIAVGIPVAHQHALREERSEARLALEDIQRAEERALLRDGHYAVSLTAAAPQGLARSAHSARGRYALSVEVAAGAPIPSFVARARAVRGTDPACSSFSLTQSGVRGAQDAQGRDTTDQCWR